MLIFTAEGPRTIDERDIRAVSLGGGDGFYTHARLLLIGDAEISGAVLNGALARLVRELAASTLPSAA